MPKALIVFLAVLVVVGMLALLGCVSQPANDATRILTAGSNGFADPNSEVPNPDPDQCVKTKTIVS